MQRRIKVFVGKSFKSLDAAISFYEDYAKEVRFDPRKSGRKTTGGIITWQYMVCSRTWTVTNNAEDDLYECQCKLYQRCGILCRHIFFVFKNNDVQLIPEIYIGKRWLKKPLLISVHGSSTSTFQDQTGIIHNLL